MKTILVLLPVALASAVACGGSTPAPTSATAPVASSPAPAAAETGAPANFSEQVAAGQQVYSEKCAGCHGNSGEGSKGAPALVGLDKGALPLDPPAGAQYRKTQFKTVADIADFAVHNMPPKAPGSLSEDQYWSILAFDLKANGIDLGDKKLDAALAPTLEVPRK